MLMVVTRHGDGVGTLESGDQFRVRLEGKSLLKDAAPSARIVKVGDRVPTLTVKDDPIGDEEAHKAAKTKDDVLAELAQCPEIDDAGLRQILGAGGGEFG